MSKCNQKPTLIKMFSESMEINVPTKVNNKISVETNEGIVISIAMEKSPYVIMKGSISTSSMHYYIFIENCEKQKYPLSINEYNELYNLYGALGWDDLQKEKTAN